MNDCVRQRIADVAFVLFCHEILEHDELENDFNIKACVSSWEKTLSSNDKHDEETRERLLRRAYAIININSNINVEIPIVDLLEKG